MSILYRAIMPIQKNSGRINLIVRSLIIAKKRKLTVPTYKAGLWTSLLFAFLSILCFPLTQLINIPQYLLFRLSRCRGIVGLALAPVGRGWRSRRNTRYRPWRPASNAPCCDRHGGGWPLCTANLPAILPQLLR